MIIGITGHRNASLGCGYAEPNPMLDWIGEQISNVFDELKPEKVISGMALGTDQVAVRVCIKNNIKFVAAIPFLSQEKTWPTKSQEEYRRLVDLAAEKVIVCQGYYAPWKMFKRNEFIVDSCDLLLAVFNQINKGGAFQCVEYAKSKDKEIRIINPKDFPSIA